MDPALVILIILIFLPFIIYIPFGIYNRIVKVSNIPTKKGLGKMRCPNCQAEIPVESVFCDQCGNKINISAASLESNNTINQPYLTTVTCEQNTRSLYGGFWERFLAYIIDQFIMNVPLTPIVQFIFYLPSPTPISFVERFKFIILISSILSTVVALLYYGLFESSGMQASPGKMVLKLVVVDYEYKRISFWRAASRWLFLLLPNLLVTIIFLNTHPFFILFGTVIFYIMVGAVAVTQKKQGLHDILTGCLIVKKEMLLEKNKDQAADMS